VSDPLTASNAISSIFGPFSTVRHQVEALIHGNTAANLIEHGQGIKLIECLRKLPADEQVTVLTGLKGEAYTRRTVEKLCDNGHGSEVVDLLDHMNVYQKAKVLASPGAVTSMFSNGYGGEAVEMIKLMQRTYSYHELESKGNTTLSDLAGFTAGKSGLYDVLLGQDVIKLLCESGESEYVMDELKGCPTYLQAKFLSSHDVISDLANSGQAERVLELMETLPSDALKQVLDCQPGSPVAKGLSALRNQGQGDRVDMLLGEIGTALRSEHGALVRRVRYEGPY
jgi:hypothetical protein